MSTVATAVYNRWNDASLDTSIATLYPASDDEDAEGGPPGGSHPAARYSLPDESEQSTDRSRGSRHHVQLVRIVLWNADWETMGTWLDSVRDQFVNSESSSSNPFAISGASVQSVDMESRDRTKQGRDVIRGEILLAVTWEIANTVP